jgi:hypothetical protein
MSGIRALCKQISNLFQSWPAHDGDLPSENLTLEHHVTKPVRTLAAAGRESWRKKANHKPAYSLPIPFYIGGLPTYNWSAVLILLVSCYSKSR